jgi:hypothetical protein
VTVTQHAGLEQLVVVAAGRLLQELGDVASMAGPAQRLLHDPRIVKALPFWPVNSTTTSGWRTSSSHSPPLPIWLAIPAGPGGPGGPGAGSWSSPSDASLLGPSCMPPPPRVRIGISVDITDGLPGRAE